MNAVDSAKHILLGSGTAWVLWFLAGLSVSTLLVAVERWLTVRAAQPRDLPGLARAVAGELDRGQWQKARDKLLNAGSTPAVIAAAGLQLAGRGLASASKAMDSSAGLERARLEKRLAFLGTVGNNAPFVGLFGTVIGVIHAFEELGHAAPGHGAAAAGPIASQAVMAGIAEALVATAVGIFVALPAVAAFNYLQRKVTALLGSAQVLGDLVLAYIAAPAPPDGAPPEARDGQ